MAKRKGWSVNKRTNTYTLRYRLNGKTYGITTGCKDKPSADKWAIAFMENLRVNAKMQELVEQGIIEIDVTDGTDPISKIHLEARMQEQELLDNLTPVLTEYITHCNKTYTPSDLKKRIPTIEKFVKHLQSKGITQWESLTDVTFHDYLDKMELSKRSMYVYSQTLKAFATWLLKKNLINPVNRVGKKGKYQSSPVNTAKYKLSKRELKELSNAIVPITKDQTTKIIDAITGRDKLFITLLIHTGMRQNECLNLLWSYCDFDNKLIYIRPNKENKAEGIIKSSVKTSNSIREIPMKEIVFNALKEAYEREDRNHYVISYLGNRVQYELTTANEKAIKAIRSDFHLHLCRHTYISQSLASGNNLFSVAKVAGNTIQVITDTYGHFYHADYGNDF